MADQGTNVHNKNDYISREAAIEIICGQCAFKDACDAGVEPRCSYYIRMTQIPAAREGRCES